MIRGQLGTESSNELHEPPTEAISLGNDFKVVSGCAGNEVSCGMSIIIYFGAIRITVIYTVLCLRTALSNEGTTKC